MLNYEEFKETMEKELAFLDLEFGTVQKNNTTLDSIMAKKEKGHVSACLYLQDMYEDYKNRSSIEDIVDAVKAVFQQSYELSEIMPCNVMDYEESKAYLRTCVIGLEGNEAYLENIPHRDFLDMAVFYRISMRSASTVVTNNLLQNWDKTLEEVEKDTKDEYLVQNLLEMISGYMDIPEENKEEMLAECNQVVITSPDRMFGASAICDKKILKQAAEMLRTEEVFILPSSIQELILLPKTPDADVDGLYRMVQEVNDTEVSDKELLTYSVYVFDGEKVAIAERGNAEVSADTSDELFADVLAQDLINLAYENCSPEAKVVVEINGKQIPVTDMEIAEDGDVLILKAKA